MERPFKRFRKTKVHRRPLELGAGSNTGCTTEKLFNGEILKLYTRKLCSMSNLHKTAIEYIDEIHALLSADESVKSFFWSPLESLQDRRNEWSKDKTLLGIIGITTSGKSSILNALLGEQILPVAVTPSSGVWVWCMKGEKQQAVVEFKDSTRQVFEGDTLVKETVAQYGDESKNPGNHKQVRKIEVQQPGFIFDNGITMIDSPGLDAEGYDQHEEISLLNLLPVLDICVLAVNIKSNTDLKCSEYIRKAVAIEKPFMIIQNMKDAVTPDIGLNGIKKNVEEKLKDHKKRVENVLERSGVDASKVNIVQVSAVQGLSSRISGDSNLWEISGFAEFEDLIHKFIVSRKPLFENSRLKSLLHFMDTRVLEENQRTNEFDIKKEGSTGIHPDEVDRQFSVLSSVFDQINDYLSKAEPKYQESLTRIEQLARNDFNGGEQLFWDLMGTLKWVESETNTQIQNAENLIAKLVNSLSMSALDANVSIVNLMNYPEYAPNIKSESNWIEQVPKKGAISWVARKLGWGGYEEKPHHDEWVNKDALRAGLSKLISRHNSKFQPAANVWLDKRRLSALGIEQEKNRYRIDYNNRQQKRAYEHEIVSTFEMLSRIRNSMQETLHNSTLNEERVNTNPADSQNKFQQGSISLMSKWLLHKSFKAIHSNLRGLLQTDSIYKSAEAIVVAGWNEEMLALFMQRFFELQIEHSVFGPGSQGYIEISAYDKNFIIINLRECNDDVLNHNVHKILENCMPVILLLDAHQVGATKSEINRSRFIEELSGHQVGLFPVMESIEEGRNSQALSEFAGAFDDILQSIRAKEFRVHTILVNHPNPVYSKLLHTAYLPGVNSIEKFSAFDRILKNNYMFISDQREKQLIVNDFLAGLKNLIKE